jgi:hypothetical protein
MYLIVMWYIQGEIQITIQLTFTSKYTHDYYQIQFSNVLG